MNLDPDRLKRLLVDFCILIALLACFFVWGYWTATSRAAGQLKAAIAASAQHGVASAALGAQGDALKAQAQASEPELAQRLNTVAKAGQRVIKAQQAVEALHLPDKLPDIPANQPVIALQEARSALQDENAALRGALSEAITRGDAWKASSDKFEQAWREEQLHSLALQGQLAAQQAEGRKAVFKAEFRAFSIGVPVGAAIAAIALKR